MILTNQALDCPRSSLGLTKPIMRNQNNNENSTPVRHYYFSNYKQRSAVGCKRPCFSHFRIFLRLLRKN